MALAWSCLPMVVVLAQGMCLRVRSFVRRFIFCSRAARVHIISTDLLIFSRLSFVYSFLRRIGATPSVSSAVHVG